MQCSHCAHLDSIRYGTSWGVQRYRCQACRQTFQTMRRGKDPALKEQAQKLYLTDRYFIPIALYHQSKTFNNHIQLLNSRLRHYLARLYRRVLCYNKSKGMLKISLKLITDKRNNA